MSLPICCQEIQTSKFARVLDKIGNFIFEKGDICSKLMVIFCQYLRCEFFMLNSIVYLYRFFLNC